MRRATTAAALALLTTGFLVVHAPAPAQDEALPVLPRVVTEDTELRGHYRMAEDLTVRYGVTLTLAPGTVIEVDAADASESGANPDLCEINVVGRLRAVGTEAEPIRLRGPQCRSERASSLEAGGWRWMGIILRSARSRGPDSVLRHVRIDNAYTGVQVARGSPSITRCVFRGCGVGVAAGYIYCNDQDRLEKSAGAEPLVEECLFRRCSTGVFAESNGSPLVRRSTFLGCRVGAGNDRPGIGSSIRHLGQRIHRCLFTENEYAVMGPSVVTDSLFLGNEVVLEFSLFHTRFSSLVDRIAWRGNVLHENLVLSESESDFGLENIVVDPQVSGVPVTDADGELPAYPAGLSFAPGSPVLGLATDGGDPGPTGRKGAGRDVRAWKSADAALRRALVLGPVGALPAAGAPESLRVPPRVGGTDGDAWWVIVEVGPSGGIDGAPLGWKPDTDLPLVFPFVLPKTDAPSARIEVNVDGRVAARTGGALLDLPTSVQRFGARGPILDLGGGAGQRHLYVRWRPADVLPRLGVAIHTPRGTPLPDGLDMPPLRVPGIRELKMSGRWVGFEFDGPVHWLDLARSGVVTVLDAEGTGFDLVDLEAKLSAGGRVKAQVPPEFRLPASAVVVDGLRDAWGRVVFGSSTRLGL